MQDIVIVSAARTAVGKFGGSLAKLSATELGGLVIKDVVARSGMDPTLVGEVIMGQVLAAGAGQNPARQALMKGGIPKEVPGLTINAVCGSGLKAVMLAAQAVAWGDSEIVIAGGQENMSAAPHVLPNSRDGQRMGDWKLIDSMIVDGLWDVYNQYHMGITAENVAKQNNISRDMQDALALASQQKAAAAQAAGKFKDEITPVLLPQKKGDPVVFATDEFINLKTNADALAGLRPAFDKAGTVTAGNASGINDGAAMLVVCSETTAKAHGWKPLAVFAGCASAGCEPEQFGIGPVLATRALCDRYGYTLGQFDTVELNEAFAAQALACIDGLALDADKVNPDGGAIALGHPIGASGARLVVHLAHRIARGESSRALATLCVGGGMGIAAALETYR